MKFVSILASISLLTLVSCSPVKVIRTNHAEGFSLNRYQTFDFFEISTQGELSPSFNQRIGWIKTEVARQLTTRGLKQSSDNPDLLVNLGIVVEEKIQTRETNFRDAPTYIGQRRYSWRREEIPVGKYTVGTATVELVDRARNEMVWEGVASSVIVKNDEASKRNIARGAEKLFDDIN